MPTPRGPNSDEDGDFINSESDYDSELEGNAGELIDLHPEFSEVLMLMTPAERDLMRFLKTSLVDHVVRGDINKDFSSALYNVIVEGIRKKQSVKYFVDLMKENPGSLRNLLLVVGIEKALEDVYQTNKMPHSFDEDLINFQSRWGKAGYDKQLGSLLAKCTYPDEEQSRILCEDYTKKLDTRLSELAKDFSDEFQHLSRKEKAAILGVTYDDYSEYNKAIHTLMHKVLGTKENTLYPYNLTKDKNQLLENLKAHPKIYDACQKYHVLKKAKDALAPPVLSNANQHKGKEKEPDLNPNYTRLTNCKKVLNDKLPILAKRRDTAFVTLLKGLGLVFFGFVTALSLGSLLASSTVHNRLSVFSKTGTKSGALATEILSDNQPGQKFKKK